MDRNTEIRRLAQALYKEPSELDYLEALDAVALQKLRTTFQNSLLNKFGPVFERIAGAGKLAPDAISATLCTKVFGPAITANMSYFTPMSKAVGLCKHFDADFMADIARNQIPERAQDMLAELPVELMKKVTIKLIHDGEFHVLGGFTDFMPEKKTIEIMEVIEDPAVNLHVSYYAQRKDRIAKLATMLSDEKLLELIAAAYATEDFINEILLITSEMSKKDQARMAKLTEEVNPEYLDKAAKVAKQAGLTEKLAGLLN